MHLSTSDRKSSDSNRTDGDKQSHDEHRQQHKEQSSDKYQLPIKQQRKLSAIQNEIQQSQYPYNSNTSNQPGNNDTIQLPKPQPQTQAPNRYSLYRESFNFNWNMKQFDITKAIQQFGKLDQHPQLEDTDEQQYEKQLKQLKNDEIKLRVYKSSKETTGLTKKTTYFIIGRDKSGRFEISRYYSEFVLLRQKLLSRWPGCFIPPLPTKKFGNNPYQLVLIRIRYLNNFLKGLSRTPQIYYGQQCQIMFNHQGDYITTNGKLIQHQLQTLKPHQNQQLLDKYKQAYGQLSNQSLSEQQQTIAINEIKELQQQLKSWKVDISRFKEQIRSLITSKDKYYQAMTRLSTVLLPEFQSLVVDWINESEVGKQTLQTDKQLSSNTSKQGYLLNTTEYGNALKDAALSVRDYNRSLWIIYDIFKFELKQTDAILQAIQSYQFLLRQMEYLNRNIGINKQQIESLEVKKTTLKIFMMAGTVEEKRTRINKQTQGFQERLCVVKQLLNLVLNVLINSIDNYHNHRAQTYKRLLAKSAHEQLVLVKKLMDFHVFELETFRKKDLFNNYNQRGEVKGQQEVEIVEEDNQ